MINDLRQEDQVQAQVGEGFGIIVHKINKLLASQFVISVLIDALKDLGDDLLRRIHIRSHSLLQSWIVFENELDCIQNLLPVQIATAGTKKKHVMSPGS
jgi:hypothetical protein